MIKVSNRFGFTLAEILITLTIIGVVSAITIPALINITRNAELVAALKKQYTVLYHMQKMMELDSANFSDILYM